MRKLLTASLLRAILQVGWGQAYLPSEDLAIATAATLDEEAKDGTNGGMLVFEEIASVLAPDHPHLSPDGKPSVAGHV
jgi:hypothetical protein